jgi:tetratricopeptide (TPR) repeat protein
MASPEVAQAPGRPGAARAWEGRIAPALAFLATAGLLVAYALRGGSYDIVVRQEMGLGIWWVLGLGFALGVLPRAPVPRVRLLGVATLVLVAVWVAIGLGWTESAERTTAELGRIVAYAGVLLLPLTLLDRTTWRAAVGGIVAAALLIAVLGVASRLFPNDFPTDLIRASFKGQRLSYPFHYWNAVGSWAAMAIALALAWSAHARLLVGRMLALAAIPIAGVAVYLTYSRSSVAGVALGVLVVLAASRNRWVVLVHALAAGLGAGAGILAVRDAPQIAHATGSAGAGRVILVLVLAALLGIAAAGATWALHGERWRLDRRPAWALLAGILAVVAVVGAIALPSPARKAWDQFNEDPFKLGKQAGAEKTDPAAHLSTLSGNRRNLWASALDAFAAHPAGTGAGTFEFWWDRDARNAEFVRDAHSLYLESLAELGWPGFLLVVLFLVTVLWLAIRARRHLRGPPGLGASAGLIGAFAVFLLTAGVDWMWESTAVSVLALLAIATAGAVPVGDAEGASGLRLLPRPLPVPWRVAATVAALLACLIELPALVSTSEVRRSQSSVRAGALDRALRQANDAIAAEPWAATPYVQRALIEEREGKLRAARVDLQRAVAREPTNWRHPLALARVEAELGDARAALRYYERARRLHPLSPVFGTSTATG